MQNEMALSFVNNREDDRSCHSDYEILQKTVQNLKNKIALLRALINANPFPTTVWNLEDHLVFINNSYAEMFGNRALLKNHEAWNDPIIESYRKTDSFLEIKNGKVVRFPPSCCNPVEIHPDLPDKPMWIESVGCPILDKNSAVEYVLFTYVDITRDINLKSENRRLRTEIHEAEITIRNISALLKEEKEKIENDLARDIRFNLIAQITRLKEKDVITHKDISCLKETLYGEGSGTV